MANDPSTVVPSPKPTRPRWVVPLAALTATLSLATGGVASWLVLRTDEPPRSTWGAAASTQPKTAVGADYARLACKAARTMPPGEGETDPAKTGAIASDGVRSDLDAIRTPAQALAQKSARTAAAIARGGSDEDIVRAKVELFTATTRFQRACLSAGY
jgi:hypothetical protein